MALEDGRYGHPSKLRGKAHTFLEEQCRQASSTPSSLIQALLHERFDLRSVSARSTAFGLHLESAITDFFGSAYERAADSYTPARYYNQQSKNPQIVNPQKTDEEKECGDALSF
jgi:hypothetical protein